MQVKTFRAANTKAALDRVKAALGMDAVILSTKHSGDEEETSWCEVTAALDDPVEQHTPAGARTSDFPDDASSPGLPGWGEWHQQWDEIKGHMLALIKARIDLTVLPPRQRMPLEHLEKEGVSEGAILSLFEALQKDANASVLSPLGQMVPVCAWSGEEWIKRLHAFTGPSGCGKTSSLLRMALHFKQAYPQARILALNLDHEQGKGRLFLKHYAELSGIAYREAATASEVLKYIASEATYDKIFIDIPALGPEVNLQQYLSLLGLSGHLDMDVHLILAPLYDETQMNAFIRQYKSQNTASLVWTKLDETCRFGALVNIAHATGLPVSALSFGAGLSNSLVAADAVMLWQLIFKHELPARYFREPEEKSALYPQ